MKPKSEWIIPDARWVKFVEIMTGTKIVSAQINPSMSVVSILNPSKEASDVLLMGANEFILYAALRDGGQSHQESIFTVQSEYDSLFSIYSEILSAEAETRHVLRQRTAIAPIMNWKPFSRSDIEKYASQLGVGVRFDNDRFWIRVNDFTLSDPAVKVALHYDWGEAGIRYDGSPHGFIACVNGSVFGTGKPSRVTSFLSNPHPHWSSDHVPCLGNRTNDYRMYRSGRAYYYMMEVIKDCITTYNSESPYVHLWGFYNIVRRAIAMGDNKQMKLKCPYGHILHHEGGGCVEDACRYFHKTIVKCSTCNQPKEYDDVQAIRDEEPRRCYNPMCDTGYFNLGNYARSAIRKETYKAAEMLRKLQQSINSGEQQDGTNQTLPS